MTAADIAAVRHVFGNEAQRRSIFSNDPFHTQTPDLLFKRNDRQFEFSLFQRNGEEFVWKWGSLLISNKRVQQRKAILAAGDGNRNPVARPQHRETAHGPAHRVENSL